MNEKNKLRNRILNTPSYWVEKVNGLLYEAIIEFMEKNNMKKKDLANHLGISSGRVSQILNDGEINFSLDKIIQIAIKVGYYPNFELILKDDFLRKEEEVKQKKQFCANFVVPNFASLCEHKGGKIVPFKKRSKTENLLIAL